MAAKTQRASHANKSPSSARERTFDDLLEEVRYIACHKFFESRIPRTEYRLTPTGRRALETYIGQMEDLIRRTKGK